MVAPTTSINCKLQQRGLDAVCNDVESTLNDKSKSASSSGNEFVMGLVDPLNNILFKSEQSSPSLPPTSTSSTSVEKL